MRIRGLVALVIRPSRVPIWLGLAPALILGSCGANNSATREPSSGPLVSGGGQQSDAGSGNLSIDSSSPSGQEMAGVADNASRDAIAGNFVTSGRWRGELYLVADSTTTFFPSDFSNRTAGEPVCVSGTVPASADFSSFFELGININQEPGGPANAAVLEGTGLALRLTQNVAGALRAQIVDPNSSQDNTRWCANLSGPGPYLLPWTDFNTACWNGSGTFFDASDLRSVAVVVPGSNTVDTPFDFCIEGFADAQAVEEATLN